MKKILTLTAAALLWGTASFAAIDANAISATYTAAGYTNLQVTPSGGDWMVTATKGGQTTQFMVDGATGVSVVYDNATSSRVSLAGTGDDDGDTEGADDNDDNGGDNNGSDSHSSNHKSNDRGGDNDSEGGNDNDD